MGLGFRLGDGPLPGVSCEASDPPKLHPIISVSRPCAPPSHVADLPGGTRSPFPTPPPLAHQAPPVLTPQMSPEPRGCASRSNVQLAGQGSKTTLVPRHPEPMTKGSENELPAPAALGLAPLSSWLRLEPLLGSAGPHVPQCRTADGTSHPGSTEVPQGRAGPVSSGPTPRPPARTDVFPRLTLLPCGRPGCLRGAQAPSPSHPPRQSPASRQPWLAPCHLDSRPQTDSRHGCLTPTQTLQNPVPLPSALPSRVTSQGPELCSPAHTRAPGTHTAKGTDFA